MKVTARMHAIALVLYSLPFLAVIVVTLFFVWAGTLEMIVTIMQRRFGPSLLFVFFVCFCATRIAAKIILPSGAGAR